VSLSTVNYVLLHGLLATAQAKKGYRPGGPALSHCDTALREPN